VCARARARACVRACVRVRACVFVCPWLCLRNYTPDLHQIFCACYLFCYFVHVARPSWQRIDI